MRLIHEIALDILAARPYLRAMLCLGTTSDKYGCEDGESVVLYFLANAQTFRGPAAHQLKQELKELLRHENTRRNI